MQKSSEIESVGHRPHVDASAKTGRARRLLKLGDAMRLVVPCECGNPVSVMEGDAGSTVTCRCGRAVSVPSLRELRRQSGAPETRPSPEMAIEALLLAGKL